MNGPEQRFLVYAPVGRDAALTCELLLAADYEALVCRSLDAMCDEVMRGAAGIFVAEEVMARDATSRIVAILQQQEPWADLPIMIFSAAGSTHPNLTRLVDALGNVTVLDRPVRPVAMLSAARAALRARRRQYQAGVVLRERAAAVRERDEFLAMLGHELRNPLGTLVLATEAVTRTLPENSRHLEIVRRQAKHLTHLVDDLLDVARITTGKVVLHEDRLSLAALVRRVVDTATLNAERVHLSLTLDADAESFDVDGDRVRIEQVVGNLLTNSLKYTPSGGHISVELHREGSFAVLRVRDDGVGMSSETLRRVFDLFAQAERTLARSEGGLGIGLTVVRRLVELHGGNVEADSAGLGHGSVFTVRLPLAITQVEVRQKDVIPAPDVADRITRRVLIVEDGEDTRELMRELLEMRGHEVEAAADGIDGLARAVRSKPDVALVDLGLPGIDGLAVARGIREQLGAQMFLVALTGYGQAEDERRALDAGFDQHMVKPIDTARLCALLESKRGP